MSIFDLTRIDLGQFWELCGLLILVDFEHRYSRTSRVRAYTEDNIGKPVINVLVVLFPPSVVCSQRNLAYFAGRTRAAPLWRAATALRLTMSDYTTRNWVQCVIL